MLAATDPGRFDAIAAPLRVLSGETTIWLAGAGADADGAERVGAELLDLPPVAAAAVVAAKRPRARARAGRRPSRDGGSGAPRRP